MYVHSSLYEPGRDKVDDVKLAEDDEDEEEEEENDGEDENEMEHSDKKAPEAVEKPPVAESTNSLSKKPKPMSLINIGPHLEKGSLPSDADFYVKYDDVTGEHIMERVDTRKWCCEKCPYATEHRERFENHALLHGSRQKCVCEYCDYSVPNYALLMVHKRLHLAPNPNLLSTQSIANLQHLPTTPADVAAAANFPAAINDPASAKGAHDHLQVYIASSP